MSTAYEDASYVGELDNTIPSDNGVNGKRTNGAAEIRKLKDVLVDSFPAVTGAVTASHTELNQLDDVSVGGNTSGDIVTTDDAQTLTNKTLTSPTINGGTISGITDLAVADGGTGASNAAGARTNLGLGSIATQASNNVNIDGGAIDGTVIGANSASSATFTGIISTGLITQQGYTKLGDSANVPSIKTVYVTTTTGSSQGDDVSVSLGVDVADIISVTVLVSAATIKVPPEFTEAPGYQYHYRLGLSGQTITIVNSASNSSSILSKTVEVFAIYKA